MTAPITSVARRPSEYASTPADDERRERLLRMPECDKCHRRYASRVTGVKKVSHLCGYCIPMFPTARLK